jgi:hypothetical protein
MYSTTNSCYKTYKSSDSDFTFSPDGITLVPRAAFKISQRCPENYRDLLVECINHGWLQVVAHQPVHEDFMEKLST